MLDWNRIFQNIEENTCIDVKPGSSGAYVKIGRGDGNRVEEYLGYLGPKQHVLMILKDSNPSFTSAEYNTMKHEFLHALGLEHSEFNKDPSGTSGPYDWDKAYRTLRKLYSCPDIKYPRDVPKREGASGCEDVNPEQCQWGIGTRGKDTACKEEIAKQVCAKTCDLCDGSNSGGNQDSVSCSDGFDNCGVMIMRSGKAWVCKQHKDACTKSCGNC